MQPLPITDYWHSKDELAMAIAEWAVTHPRRTVRIDLQAEQTALVNYLDLQPESYRSRFLHIWVYLGESKGTINFVIGGGCTCVYNLDVCEHGHVNVSHACENEIDSDDEQ